jgi:hypothetical protein
MNDSFIQIQRQFYPISRKNGSILHFNSAFISTFRVWQGFEGVQKRKSVFGQEGIIWWQFPIWEIELVDETELAQSKDYSLDFEEDLRKVAEFGDIYDQQLAPLPKFELHKNGKNMGWTKVNEWKW